MPFNLLWHSPPPLELDDTPVVYAISCPCCNSELYFWYLQNLPPHAVTTTSNIWINYNFPQFKKDFLELERDAVLITNYRGKGKQFGKLNIKKHYTVDDDCVNFWEREGQALIKQIIEETGDESNLLYAFSAGPLSEPIMMELFKNNPNNCYVDFGSALNFIVHEGVTRPFMVENHPLSKKTCWIFNNKQLDLRIDVLLTAYKRPQVLEQQLQAVKNQTLKPARILLYQDGINSYYNVELKEDILKQFDDYKIAKENTGVWQRFAYAAEASTSKYVCIFDDDTIPGQRWLENCYIHMQQNRGVYGTNGVLLIRPELYPYKDSMINAGWHTANEELTEVDFVGHSWFAERDCVNAMIKKPYINRFKYVGEDMCLSFVSQENGIPTYVPPHPINDLSLWGSNPRYGLKYGVSEVALSVSMPNLRDMNSALRSMHKDGWKFVIERNPQYVRNCIPKLNRKLLFNQQDQLLDTEYFKFVLSFFGRKQPVFLGDSRWSDSVKNIFNLSNREYITLNDANGQIHMDFVLTSLRRYAIHIFFTDVIEQMRPILIKVGLRENEDFLDGRKLLTLTN